MSIKKLIAFALLLILVTPILSVSASPDYVWFPYSVTDLQKELDNDERYTDDYLLYPVLPLKVSELYSEQATSNGKQYVLSYCKELHRFDIGGFIDNFCYYDISPYFGYNYDFLSCHIRLGAPTTNGVEAYNKGNWTKHIIPTSTEEKKFFSQCTSEKGKELLIREECYENYTDLAVYQLVEGKYVFGLRIFYTGAGLFSIYDFGDMHEINYFKGLLKKLADEVEFVKIPLDASEAEVDNILATAEPSDLDWPQIALKEESSENDYTSEESESSIELAGDESVDFSPIPEDSVSIEVSVESNFVEETSAVTSEAVDDNDKSTGTKTGIYIVISLLVIATGALALCMYKSKKHKSCK